MISKPYTNAISRPTMLSIEEGIATSLGKKLEIDSGMDDHRTAPEYTNYEDAHRNLILEPSKLLSPKVLLTPSSTFNIPSRLAGRFGRTGQPTIQSLEFARPLRLFHPEARPLQRR